MKTIVYVFLLSCSALLGGCSGERQTQKPPTAAKESPPMIKIDSLEVTDKTLTLDYRVSNPCADEIYICEASCVFHCVEEAGTGIHADTVLITRCTKINGDTLFLVNPPDVAKYLRLRPGESHSWRIVLDLPILKLPSGVYSLDEDLANKGKRVVLHRAILTIGYFPPRYNRFFVNASATSMAEMGIKDGDMSVVSPDFGLRIDPYVVDEIQEGKSRRVLYIGDNSPSQELEESVEVLITDVNIPCSVQVDDK